MVDEVDRYQERLKRIYIPKVLTALNDPNSFDIGVKIANHFGVKPEGIPGFRTLLTDLSTDSTLTLPKYRGILNGYGQIAPDMGKLGSLAETGGLLIFNYPASMEPFFPAIFVSSEIESVTRRDTTFLLPYKNPFTGYRRIIRGVYDLVQNRMEEIVTGDPHTSIREAPEKIVRSLSDRKILGAFIQRQPTPTLERATPEAGYLLKLASGLNVPVVTIGIWKDEEDRLHLRHKSFEAQDIRKVIGSMGVVRHPAQLIADVLLGEIAALIPPEFGGTNGKDEFSTTGNPLELF